MRSILAVRALGLLVLALIGALTTSLAHAGVALAVSYFDNTSQDATLDPLRKGLADMLITDLSVSDEITLVERDRLADVLGEIDLQRNPFFDPAGAAALGEGLGAAYIVTGSYLVHGTQLRIDARIVDVETAEIVLAVGADGTKDEILSVQKSLARELLSGIGAELTLIERNEIGQSSTSSFDAFTLYAVGLDSLDQGDLEAAAAAISGATELDPDFAAAQSMRKTLEAMRAAIDVRIDEDRIRLLVPWFAGTDCACSYAPLEEGGHPPTTAADRLARRWFETHHGAQSGVISSVSSYIPYQIVFRMTEFGLFEEAEAMAASLLAPEMLSTQAVTWSAPRYGLPGRFLFWGDNMSGVGESRARIELGHRCMAMQVASYVQFRQLQFEEAMAWQLKAADLPAADEELRAVKGYCMDGSQFEHFGVPIAEPLRDVIQRVLDDPESFSHQQAENAVAQATAPAARARIEALGVELDCESLCPWSADSAP